MVYFCADDYGLSAVSNARIEHCIQNGILNKVSVLPNGEITDLQNCLNMGAKLTLHVNLIEGRPLSDPAEIDLLVGEDGRFKHSFVGLFLLSLFKRKQLYAQLYKEVQSQLRFWKQVVGENTPVMVDSHQHTHMIPCVFKALTRAICDEGLTVEYIRIPAEPILPYVLTPSLYLRYSPVGLVKQWLLKVLFLFDHKELMRLNTRRAYFMGVLFTGKLDEAKVRKLLPRYINLAKKRGCDVEVGFHPGYFEAGERPSIPIREGFQNYYFSRWRKVEHDTLMNIRF